MYTCDGSLVIRDSAAAGGHLRLTLSGCLDIATAPRLQARLRELEGGVERIELDLEQVEFIDLQGLRVLHAWLLAEGCGAAAHELRPRLSRCVRRLADLTGVELWPIPHPRGAADALRVSRTIRPRVQASRQRRVARR